METLLVLQSDLQQVVFQGKKSYLLKEDFSQVYLDQGIAIFYLNFKDLTNAFLSIIFEIIV